MKDLLSAATFGLLPTPLPHAVGLDRQLKADLAGSRPRPEGETTEGEPCEDEGPMRRRPHRATADAAKAR
jgi:hypothetical protein